MADDQITPVRPQFWWVVVGVGSEQGAQVRSIAMTMGRVSPPELLNDFTV